MQTQGDAKPNQHAMPDTQQVTAEPVQVKGPENEGSVHQILSRLKEERRYEPPAAPGEESSASQPQASPAPEDVAPPQGEPSQPPPETPASERPEEEKPRFKYKSQLEAEEAYKEAERRMHQATTEKAELQRELEALKARLAELEKAQEEKGTSEAPAETPPFPKEEAVQRIVAINEQIDELDPYDPDYPKRRAELELEKAILLDSVRQRTAMPTPEAIKEIVRQEMFSRQQEEEQARALEDLQRQAIELAKAHGLDMTPGSWDYKQFWRAVRAGDVPVGEGITLEQQVKALADEILSDRSAFGQKAVRNLQEIHDRHAVLERGGSGPAPGSTEQFRPSSIHEIIAANRRRI